MNSLPTEMNDAAYFDVREISCREKHALIFQRWAEVPVGGCFILINGHDPVPLYYQFAAQFPGAFTWEYLLGGPDEFHIKITRTAATTAQPMRPAHRGCGEARASDVLDLRGLEPPELMRRILEALVNLPAGGQLQALTDRKPVHLLAELPASGVAHASHENPDGSWINTFCRL